MIYKEITLASIERTSIDTELMYEIATARADGVELLRIFISSDPTDERRAPHKISANLIRRLKILKESGLIQLYADKRDFSVMSTQAHFLINKYPQLFDVMPSDEGNEYFYVKI